MLRPGLRQHMVQVEPEKKRAASRTSPCRAPGENTRQEERKSLEVLTDRKIFLDVEILSQRRHPTDVSRLAPSLAPK
jgi:hypothetical protein